MKNFKKYSDYFIIISGILMFALSLYYRTRNSITNGIWIVFIIGNLINLIAKAKCNSYENKSELAVHSVIVFAIGILYFIK